MAPPDDARQRLIDAAGHEFAEKGFQAATVRSIVDRAGVNIAAVNYYFGDKERLYLECVKSACQRKSADVPVPQWPEGTDPAQKLREFIQMLVTRMMGGDPAPWHEPLMVREMTQPTPTCRQFVQEFVRPMATVLLGILGELAPNASLADRYLIGFSIVGQCFYHKVNRPVITLLVGEEEYSKYSLDRLAEHITHFSLAALGHAPPLNAEGGGA